MSKKISLYKAIIPLIFLIGFLSLNVYFFGDDTLSGANQIALLLAASIAAFIAFLSGFSWDKILKGILSNISAAMPAMLILLLIGALAGTWLISGVVPTMIYYGLEILNPKIFLFATVIISAMVSLATGSSWSTVATIGVALLGIGKALGFSDGIIAGAIISGAYFGDKVSPLSDTTNLAPAMAGTDLFTHIRYMMVTTIPSLIITLIIFLIVGFNTNLPEYQSNINDVLTALDSKFNINIILFLVPIILIIIIIKKVPPLPALLVGALLGVVFAIIFQPQIINQISGIYDNYFSSSYITSLKAMYGNISINTNNEIVNKLLSTDGMAGMLNTIWLIISAMIFGGVMEASGMLKVITSLLISKAKSAVSLVSTTVATCIFFNVTASDQYISIVVPGRMFKDVYKDKGFAPELLSRTLEDSGTVTSVLIPWNTCGATQSKVLGVPTLTYLPFAFFNIISPIMSIAIAAIGYKIKKNIVK